MVDFVIPNLFQKTKKSNVVFRKEPSIIDINEKTPLLIREADVDYESIEGDKQAARLMKTRSQDMFAVKVWPVATPVSFFGRGGVAREQTF